MLRVGSEIGKAVSGHQAHRLFWAQPEVLLQSIQSCLTSPVSIGMLFLFVSYEWVGDFCDRGVLLAILPPPLESIALTVSSQPEEALVNPLYGSQLVL